MKKLMLILNVLPPVFLVVTQIFCNKVMYSQFCLSSSLKPVHFSPQKVYSPFFFIAGFLIFVSLLIMPYTFLRCDQHCLQYNKRKRELLSVIPSVRLSINPSHLILSECFCQVLQPSFCAGVFNIINRTQSCNQLHPVFCSKNQCLVCVISMPSQRRSQNVFCRGKQCPTGLLCSYSIVCCALVLLGLEFFEESCE